MVAREVQADPGHVRLRWIDVAKGLGIILVVLGHAERGLLPTSIHPLFLSPKILDDWVYCFHMPLFFVVSGVALRLARQSTLWELLKRRAFIILYPYLVWSLLQGAVEISVAPYTNGHATLSQVLSFAWAPRAQFWFLYVLFLCTVLCVFLRNLKGHGQIILIAIACVAAMHSYGLSGVWVLDRVTFNFAFMYVGFSLPKAIVAHRDSNMHASLTVLVGLGMLLAVLLFVMAYPVYEAPVLRFIMAGVGVVGLSLVALSLDILAPHVAGRLAYVGTRSLEIYLMHIVLIAAVRLFFVGFGLDVSFEVAVVFLCAIGVLGSLWLDQALRTFGLGWLFRLPTGVLMETRTRA